MSYYYYPLCSKDFTFENIFSSESISPPDFYPLREFGMDFFYTLPFLHNKHVIVLYSNPPKFPNENANDYIRFILKIDSATLDAEELVAISEGILGYRKTIYLAKSNFEVLFFSEKDKKVTLLKAESSLTTKGLKKFEENFKVANETECIEFDLTEIGKIGEDSNSRDLFIKVDRDYNQYKGFCCGIACGVLKNKTKSEIRVNGILQEIVNHFASFKNKLENSQSRFQNKASIKDAGQFRVALDSQAALSELINEAESLFIELFEVKRFSEEDLELFLRDTYKDLKLSPEEAKTYLKFKKLDDAILGSDGFSKLKSAFLKSVNRSNPIAQFEGLREQIKTYVSTIGQVSDWAKTSRERVNDSFKQGVANLSRFAEDVFTKAKPAPALDLSGISYYTEEHKISLKPNFYDLTRSELDEYILTINIILSRGKRGKGEAKSDELLTIVQEVGSKHNMQKPGKNSLLYQYLKNEVASYDIERAQSVVMKNFVAFVFNPNSLEKLESFLDSKKIDSKWMAYSFWCCFSGFASISKFFVSPLFDNNDNGMSKYIDTFLNESFFNKHSSYASSIIRPVVEEKSFAQSREEIENWKVFYEKYLHDNKKISLDEFKYIITLIDKDQMIAYLKERCRFSKRDATKVIDQYFEFIKNPVLF